MIFELLLAFLWRAAGTYFFLTLLWIAIQGACEPRPSEYDF